MSIICEVDYSTALRYKGANLTTKYNNKKHNVYLKLVCDDLSLIDGIELSKSSKNILMIDYQGLDTNIAYSELTKDVGVYIGRLIDFGNNITSEDVEHIVNNTPQGVTPIINLPDDYKDMRFIWEVSKKYPTVRFCGGSLFAIDGVKLGAIGIDILDKVGAKYDVESYTINGSVDAIETVDINTLTIDTTEPKRKSKRSGSGNSKAPKKTKVYFTDILGGL